MQATILTKSFSAHSAISKRSIVALRGDGTVETAVGSNGKLIGLSTDIDTQAGEPCDAHMLGIGEAVAGAALAAGDTLTSNSTGQVIATSTTGHSVVGVALEPASSADEIISVLLTQSIR